MRPLFSVLTVLALAVLAGACSGEKKAAPLDPLPPVAPIDGSGAVPLAPIPNGLPALLELGMSDAPGGVGKMLATAPFRYRYQYLAGGVQDSWREWAPDGGFVAAYIKESADAGMVPVFSYYMLLQSTKASGSEADRLVRAFKDGKLMRRYYEDLEAFFVRAGERPGRTVVLHVEPDLWGHAQQRAPDGDPRRLPVKVDASGFEAADGLPDTFAGFAQLIVKLRERHAPNVLLAWHVSTWATGEDFVYTDPSGAHVDELAAKVGRFYRGLDASFELAFAEFSDRDAGYKEHVSGDGGASWFTPEDFERHARYIAGVASLTGSRVVLWQIPYGNTRMTAVNDTHNHYRDNRVEWLLDDASRGHLERYARAGVIALLFGRGADGATDASDAAGDGTTNPDPHGSNTRRSLNSDDDGGFFRKLAADYYREGALPLR